MDTRSPIKLPPSLHRSLVLAQHAEFLLTGKRPPLGALLEAAWTKANNPCNGPAYTGQDENPIISESQPTLIELRSTLHQALALLDGVIDGSTTADDIGKVERALATGNDLGVDRQDSAPARVTKPARRGR